MRGLFSLFLFAAATLSLAGADLQGPAMSLSLRDGVIVGLSNRLSGEQFVVKPSIISLPAGLHRIGEPLLKAVGAAETVTSNRLTQSLTWSNVAAWDLRAEIDPATEDVLFTQTGTAALKKLSGISWSIADIPDHFEVLVPGCSGQRFSAEAPIGRREFDYPMLWEASFVLIQGHEGGLLIRTEDAPPRYKNLVVEHTRGAFRLRFESRNRAPFEEQGRIESCRWRITAYRGSWQTGAAIYRRWAGSQAALTSLERQPPGWVRDIRFVVTMNLDRPLLSELARHCSPPQTLLYVPSWRRDEYDRNYPDYTATTNFGSFLTEAHRLGFRVMPHVNYFGCDPKHPLFAELRRWQMRDPLSKELLWWEWPANPPIKFAYINPSSRVWRRTFVARMVELCRQFPADALHLDQTLCIYNDGNGLVDGQTCLEGNLALHRELRAALPEVALSGEGLNEITGQHEAFAQRHIWGMDHAHGTWDDRLIAMSHPISSAVLTPYTHLYGYLGMANPANPTAYVAWRRAYEHFGVLPTYTWPDATQLANPPPYVAEVLAQARFFQQHRPVPDYESAWATNNLFLYRLANGGDASFRRDQGVALGRNESPSDDVTRRIEGANIATVSGSLLGWPAYDVTRVFGLDPAQAYPWSPQRRDLAALHLAQLPEGVVIEQSGRHPEFARFRFRDMKTVTQTPLWNYSGEIVSGVRFSDGTTRTSDTLDLDDETSGGTVHPDGVGLFLHPPWKGPEAASGRPVTFVEFALRLPKAGPIAFEAGVHLREGAIGKSDGVIFRVLATREKQTLSAETHHDRLEPKSLRLDLAAYAGADIRLRLEVDAGPDRNPTFDWARIASPTIIFPTNAVSAERNMTVAGVKALQAALTPSRQLPLPTEPGGPTTFAVPVPGALILALTEPVAISLPCDLLSTKFTSHVLFADGIEQPAFSYFGGGVTKAACGGVERRALGLHPPQAGRSLADYLVRLPEVPARLVTAIGLRDGSKSKGVGFAVQVNGEIQFSQSLQPGTGWVPASVNLARWRGQPVLLTLITDSEGDFEFDWAVWAEPQLEAP